MTEFWSARSARFAYFEHDADLQLCARRRCCAEGRDQVLHHRDDWHEFVLLPTPKRAFRNVEVTASGGGQNVQPHETIGWQGLIVTNVEATEILLNLGEGGLSRRRNRSIWMVWRR